MKYYLKRKTSMWEKKDILKSLHINEPLNMKHHMDLEGKCTERKMEIAGK